MATITSTGRHDVEYHSMHPALALYTCHEAKTSIQSSGLIGQTAKETALGKIWKNISVEVSLERCEQHQQS